MKQDQYRMRPEQAASRIILWGLILSLLASCATMKKPDAEPVNDPCKKLYHDALYGKKEELAGGILLPGGLLLTSSTIYFIPFGATKHDDALLGFGWFALIAGPTAVIAGIVTLIDGNSRVKEWNESCMAQAGDDRYCLQYLGAPPSLPFP
ncbi:MAG TPA: hypothetical protein PKH10_06175 [bacterium]|nr:hypothetical protein [bacterium]